MLTHLQALRYIAGDPCSPGSSSSSDLKTAVPAMGSKCFLLAACALNCSWSTTSGPTSARLYNTLQVSNCSATSTGRLGFVHRRWSESRVLLCNTRAGVSVGTGTRLRRIGTLLMGVAATAFRKAIPALIAFFLCSASRAIGRGTMSPNALGMVETGRPSYWVKVSLPFTLCPTSWKELSRCMHCVRTLGGDLCSELPAWFRWTACARPAMTSTSA